MNLSDLNIHATIKKITLRIMLGSIPHQKFCFYHLPTRGRAEQLGVLGTQETLCYLVAGLFERDHLHPTPPTGIDKP